MRVLYLNAGHYPDDWQKCANGSLRRKRLFVEAIAKMAEIDFLYYVPPETDISSARIAQIEHDIEQYWHARVNLYLCPQWEHPATLPKWQQQAAGVGDYFQQQPYMRSSGPAQVQALERCLDRQPDVIVAQRLSAMSPLLRTRRPLPPVLFDLDDIAHIRFLRQLAQTRSPKGILEGLQFPSRFWGESCAIRLASKTFVCSEGDRDYLCRRLGYRNIEVIPNSVAIPNEQPIVTEPTLLFLGGYSFGPNLQGANFLIERVWPKIIQNVPSARLILAGEAPNRIRFFGKGIAEVEFTGYVDNLDALYRRSRIVCCPIFSGAGTRVKMVEAGAYGKPIVATRIGAEGLCFTDGRDYLLRNRPKEFAWACLDLLKNDNLCWQLGSAARAAAIRHYDRKQIAKQIQEQVRQVLQLSAQGRAQALV
jgi:glycosyltransferase involved in cell wall biosynthesis